MKLKEMRQLRGLTVTYVAEQLGISHRQCNRLELGGGYMPKERVKKLGKLYKKKMCEIREGAK
jgi:transcriptional regulator with XRE-family HTH domain